jgi:hypothetical protein
VPPLLPSVGLCLQEEGVKATRAREQMAAKLVQLEKQRGDVEAIRDDLKVSSAVPWRAVLCCAVLCCAALR